MVLEIGTKHFYLFDLIYFSIIYKKRKVIFFRKHLTIYFQYSMVTVRKTLKQNNNNSNRSTVLFFNCAATLIIYNNPVRIYYKLNKKYHIHLHTDISYTYQNLDLQTHTSARSHICK